MCSGFKHDLIQFNILILNVDKFITADNALSKISSLVNRDLHELCLSRGGKSHPSRSKEVSRRFMHGH